MYPHQSERWNCKHIYKYKTRSKCVSTPMLPLSKNMYERFPYPLLIEIVKQCNLFSAVWFSGCAILIKLQTAFDWIYWAKFFFLYSFPDPEKVPQNSTLFPDFQNCIWIWHIKIASRVLFKWSQGKSYFPSADTVTACMKSSMLCVLSMASLLLLWVRWVWKETVTISEMKSLKLTHENHTQSAPLLPHYVLPHSMDHS